MFQRANVYGGINVGRTLTPDRQHCKLYVNFYKDTITWGFVENAFFVGVPKPSPLADAISSKFGCSGSYASCILPDVSACYSKLTA